ncbi:MAG: integrase family protein, partial [Planctomycetaceae bacterium]|nr:integrase family protein [Planctomycetaceae bacterium]
MKNVVHFRARADVTVQENLQGFVEVARSHLSIFGANLDFDSDVWDITEYIHLRGKGNNRMRLQFLSFRPVGQSLAPSSLAEPFKDFAKAYIRYMQGLRPTKIPTHRLVALRALEASLLENGGVADARLTTGFILNRATQLIGERYAKTTAYRIARQLETLAAFMAKNRLTAASCRWRSYLVRPNDADRVGKEFDQRRRERLPSQSALAALPLVFRAAISPADVIFSSAAALLVSAPDRISEVLTLRVDCEVNDQKPDGGSVYGLRWFPAKGAEPMVKWIVPLMVPVVREAIARIRLATDEARRMARWYESNPSKLYLPPDLEHLRGAKLLTKKDMVQLFNLASTDSVNLVCRTYGLVPTVRGRNWRVRFCDVENTLLEQLPRDFPFLDRDLGLRFSDALFVVRRHELHAQRGTNPCVIGAVSTNQINSALGGKVEHGSSSIFSRLGFYESDGTPIRVSSHQFRHYLNTLAQM